MPDSRECKCPEEYYYDIIEKKCGKCAENCAVCSGINRIDCSKCIGETTMTAAGCNCPFGDPVEGVCPTCHPHCSTCAGPEPTDCLSCLPDIELVNGSCDCQADYFLNSQGICEKRTILTPPLLRKSLYLS